MPLKLLLVAGARPNFMKIAPLIWEIQRRDDVDALLVHTGQHYDEKMSERFFTELQIPKPDQNLEVGSGSYAVQTAEVMKRFEPVLLGQKPDAVVVGDVNSTLACALTAAKRLAVFTGVKDLKRRRRPSAAVGRILKRLHVRGLVKKVLRTRLWRVTGRA